MDWLVTEVDIGVRSWAFVSIRPGVLATNKLVVTFWTWMSKAFPYRRKPI